MLGGTKINRLAASVRSSKRVRRLMGTAIQRVAKEEFGVEIPRSEAELLGSVGSVHTVVKDLSRMLEVKHRGKEVRLSRSAQRRISVQKLILEYASEGSQEQKAAREAIQAIIDEHEARARELSQAERSEDQIEHRIESLQRQWPKRRQFFRRATRLRRKQRERLRIYLGEGAGLREALDELDAIYRRYLNRASDLLENKISSG